MSIQEGVLLDMTNKEYHADNGYVSSTQLVTAYLNPKDYLDTFLLKTKKLDTEKLHFKIGSAFHTSVLESNKYKDEVIVFDGTRKGGRWEAFLLANKNKIIFSKLNEATVNSLSKSVKDYKLAQEYLENGVAEHAIFGMLQGVKAKAKADKIFVQNWIMDLKSTDGILTEKAIQATIAKRCYDLPAAWYIDLYNAYGMDIKKFVWVFSSKDNPSCKVVESTPELIENGRRKYKIALSNIEKLKSGTFKFEEKVIKMKPAEYDIVSDQLDSFI